MYAHRGYHDKPEIPENSMAAFRRAIRYGLPTEIDVHLIADGSLVIFHDEELERETGVKGIIEDYDITNLSKLRLEGTDELIPTFDEVLELYEGTGLPLLIELKVNRGNYAALTRAVAERLDRYDGPFALQSFDPRVLLELKKIRPHFTRGQLSQDFRKKKEGLPFYQIPFLTNMALNRLTKPDFISYKFKDRDNRSLRRRVDKGGMTEASWTIRSAKTLKDAVKAGCIPIFEKIEPEDLKEILGVEERKKVK
jgi:glycerophosphoryl diester phosphodiesterase